MSIKNTQYNLFYFFFLISGITFAQNTANGRIIDEKTNKPVTGVDIFINDSNKAALTTSSGDFSVQSDSIIL